MKILHLSIIAVLVIGIGAAYAYSSAGMPEAHYPPTNDTKLALLVMDSIEFKQRVTECNGFLGIDYNMTALENNSGFKGARLSFAVTSSNGTYEGIAF